MTIVVALRNGKVDTIGKRDAEGIEEAWISKKVIREEDLEKIGIQ